jgi:uncharacterized coiled-coil protein SlyX
MRGPRLLILMSLLAATAAGCKWMRGSGPREVTPARDSTNQRRRSTPPVVVRDTALEQRADRLELRVLEKEAQVEELQTRLDDARREVVRAMAKLQSLATRAEAASGMAEAEIALQALRAGGGPQTAPEIGQAAQLLQLATAEFDKQNYGGALYLANQAKEAAAAGGRRLASVERGSLRQGEVPFALPLRLQTTGRANVREGPGQGFQVAFTLDPSAGVTGYSYVDQWVRVTDESGRSGWIYQGLIGRRR